MSVKHALLALLAQGSKYGYQLKVEFERLTASVWPLNVGQVYTTMVRQERAGLVCAGGRSVRGQSFYAITESGQAELASWFSTPVVRGEAPQRDELAIKLAVGISSPGVDVRALIERQRSATAAALRDCAERLREVEAHAEFDLAQWLVLGAREAASEAELRWLDSVSSHLEARERSGQSGLA